MSDVNKEEKNLTNEFWFTHGVGKAKVNPETLEKVYAVEKLDIDERKLAELLQRNGFCRYDAGEPGQNKQPIIKIGENKIVEFVNDADVKQWVETYVKSKDPLNAPAVKKLLQKRSTTFTHAVLYDWLPEMRYDRIGLPHDNPKETWFARRNGLVCVKSTSIELHPYGKKEIYLWKEQIMQRDWNPGAADDCIFREFVGKVAGPAGVADFQKAAGYILTDNFSQACTKAVILNDSMDMDTDMSDGRRGKTLWMRVLSSVKSGYCPIDGKSWDPVSKFKFQEADHNTKIIYIDDVIQGFEFERMFSYLCSPVVSIEKKNAHPFNIPAPKFVLSTNRAIQGDSASALDRQFQLEFLPYYSSSFSPDMEYGHMFVVDWSEAEMQALDKYCFRCVQDYMNFGLRGQNVSSSLRTRMALGGIPAVFLEWAESIRPNVKKYRSEWKSEFLAYPGIPNAIKNDLATKKNLFNDWVRTWAKQKKWKVEEGRRNGNECFEFLVPESTLIEDLYLGPELKRIDAELEVALHAQDYERAAVLRDKKKAMQNEQDNDSQAV